MTKLGQEDSLIWAIQNRIKDKAYEKNRKVVDIATNGQDRHVLADLILGDQANWVLIEYKSRVDNSGIRAEERKLKSSALCEALKVEEWRAIHDACHFAGGGVGPKVEFSIYRKLFCEKSSAEGKQSSRNFIDAFFDGQIGVDPKTAEKYIQWVIKLGEGEDEEGREIQLLVDIGGDESYMENFSSLTNVSNWIKAIQAYKSIPKTFEDTTPPPPSGSSPGL